MSLCPTCHSEIGNESTNPAKRARGAQGVDSNGNPVPFWTDDPILTSRNFNGISYLGTTHVRVSHIKEIQEVRKQQEEDSGLEPTEFSEITSNTHISRKHIIELRESTERILEANSVSLEEYFKLDAEGNEQSQNLNLQNVANASSPQVEWVDVNRGEAYLDKDGNIKAVANSPTLPQRIHVRAVHIEDLRHPIPVGIPALLIHPFNGRLYRSSLKGGNFIETAEC